MDKHPLEPWEELHIPPISGKIHVDVATKTINAKNACQCDAIPYKGSEIERNKCLQCQ